MSRRPLCSKYTTLVTGGQSFTDLCSKNTTFSVTGCLNCQPDNLLRPHKVPARAAFMGALAQSSCPGWRVANLLHAMRLRSGFVAAITRNWVVQPMMNIIRVANLLHGLHRLGAAS